MHYAFTAAALFLLASQGVARAEPVLYTETTTASGMLGTKSFKDRPLTVYYLGDTSNIINPSPGIIEETGGVAGFRLSIDNKDDDEAAGIFTGGAPAVLLIQFQNAFVIGANSTNPNLNPPGANGPGGRAAGDILSLNSPALAGYRLNTAIGPIVGPGVIQSNPIAGTNGVGATFASTAGDLTLAAVGNVTFKAKLLKDQNEAESDIRDN